MYKSLLWRVAECLSYILDARCLKVKEVKITNSKSPAKEEPESCPSAWQRQTAHLSGHKGGNCNSWVDFSPLSSLQSRFCTLRLPSFWAPWRMHSEDAVLRTKTSCNTACVKISEASAKGFCATRTQHLTQRWKNCADNEVCGKIVSTL